MKYSLELLDTHAGGDVSRIIYDGVHEISAQTVREKMQYLQKNADGLRKTLLSEPYGVPEMSIDLLVGAEHKDAVAGYIIMEAMGYPIYSGSNTLCTATAVLELGLVEKKEGKSTFFLDSPAGLVRIEAFVQNDVVEAITCEGLPSYIHSYKQKLQVPNLGEVTFSVAYSGGFYALVDARDFGFALTIDEEQKLIDCAYKIVEAINSEYSFEHYSLGFIGKLPFLHFMGEIQEVQKGFLSSKSTTYVHPGVICRSTTGTGTSARLALLDYEKKIKIGDKLETISLRDTKFVGEFIGESFEGGNRVVHNTITGKSYVLAKSKIIIDTNDPMIKHDDFPHLREEA